MYDENGKERNISGDVYTEVISKMLKKCCVFLMPISKHSLSSAEVRREYSVEQQDPAKNDSMVFSYEINRKSEMFDDFIRAFKYLIEIDPTVKKTLEEQNSRILEIY